MRIPCQPFGGRLQSLISPYGFEDDTLQLREILMPIYEFYCKDCNTIFNFFSKTVNICKQPKCPRCNGKSLTRQVSVFAFTGKAKEVGDHGDLPLDEGRMEQAMMKLADEADKMNEEDPRQAADLMRKLSDMTGLELGAGMNEALRRMEKGEDPDQIEAEMGNILEEEDLLRLPDKKGKRIKTERILPNRDETLYDL